jgi:hypothetical protein
MFGAEFGEKCIIVQFLGMKKHGKCQKTSERRDAEALRKNLRKTRKYGVEKLVEWDVSKVVEC